MREVVGLGVEEEDRKRTWMGDAEEAAKRGSAETARSIYGALVTTFPGERMCLCREGGQWGVCCSPVPALHVDRGLREVWGRGLLPAQS